MLFYLGKPIFTFNPQIYFGSEDPSSVRTTQLHGCELVPKILRLKSQP